MKRRDLLHIGLAGLTGRALLSPGVATARAISQENRGGVGRVALIGEGVLGTPVRFDTNRKELGFFLLVETDAPKGVKPYDVSLFIQKQVGTDWEYVAPRTDSFGQLTAMSKAYKSALGPVVDYAVVRSKRATVALFIPYAALPFEGEDRPLGEMRFMVRFFPFNSTTKGYELDSSFDRPFGASAHMLRDGAVRSFRTYSGLERSFVIWNISEDKEE